MSSHHTGDQNTTICRKQIIYAAFTSDFIKIKCAFLELQINGIWQAYSFKLKILTICFIKYKYVSQLDSFYYGI